MTNEPLVYTLRPNGESLWLPASTAERMGLKRGERMTAEQYGSRTVQELLVQRIQAQAARGGGR